MQLMIDLDTESSNGLRFAASVLLQLAAGKDAADKAPASVPTLTVSPPVPEMPPAGSTVVVPPPPPPPFPMPTPAPAAAAPALPSLTSVIAGSTTLSAPAAPGAVEYDSSGLPWDARIHQKARSRKKDGTWKVQKGIDQNLVQSVVAELAGRRAQGVPPAQNPRPLASVVVPPPPPVEAPSAPPPPPPAPPTVENGFQGAIPPAPPPPPPAEPSVDGSAFKALLDKIVAAKLDPLRMSALVQKAGAPNLMALKSVPHLIPEVTTLVDAAIAGYA